MPTVTGAVIGATTGPTVDGGQRQRSTVANDGQRWRPTTVNGGAPPLTTAGQRSGQVATWHATSAATSACRSHVSPRGSATSADWVLLAHVAATSAADVAEGILTLSQIRTLDLGFMVLTNQTKPTALGQSFGNALTWWNSHVKTVTHEVSYALSWKTLKKMMTDKYCPRGNIKKLEIEMWNLKVKGTDVVRYNQRFQELSLMCSRMFPEELDKIEKYVGGLPDMIHGSVMASKPKTIQDEIEFATELMDQKIRTLAERHYRSYCPKLKNRNHGNQARGTEARGMVYALGGGENDQDLDNMEDDINA
ncbi:reverse transcriptase domain-containing protein [Tanacetum coccineum]